MSSTETLEKNYVQRREFDKFEAVMDKKISNIEKEVAEVRAT